jgi:fibronectin type 3 domain-containing protein
MNWSPSAVFRRLRRPARRQPIRNSHRPLLEALESRLAPSASVLTYHNDNVSSGANLNETLLTPGNVNSTDFGKLFKTPLDGQVYAQPLYVAGVNITSGPSRGIHNVTYVATEHDSLYAIDADNGQVLWQDSFINPGAGVTTVPNGDVASTDLTPEIGITGTPVIDSSTNTLYLDAKTKEVHGGNHHYVHKLHAIDITSGAEKLGGPVTIADTIFNGGGYSYVSGPFVFGSGDGSTGGKVNFNALRQAQRPGLTLANGNVYIAYASHGDIGPYHGWVLSFNAQTLQLNGVFNSTPNGGLGGIWGGGARVAVDPQGNLYFMTGNGTFDAGLNGSGMPGAGDYGDSFVKLAVDPTTNPNNQNANGWGLKVVDYFTPFDQARLAAGDIDQGSGGIMILPDSAGSAAHPHLLIGAGKEGRVYLIDRDNMGHYSGSTDHAVQHNTVLGGSYGTAAFFNGEFYYFGGGRQSGRAFTVGNGKFVSSPASQTPDVFGSQGATGSISANGAVNGILWGLDRNSNELRAYDASNLGNELYTSDQAANGRDQVGSVIKFSLPTIVNGKVYVGTSSGLVGYGLLSANAYPPPAPTSLQATAVSGTQINLTWSFSANNANGIYVEESTDAVHFTQVAMLGATATSYSAVGLQPSTTYTFRVRSFNTVGTSAYSNTASAKTTSGAGTGLDFSAGFASASSLLTLNGSAKVSGSLLQLTDGHTSEAGSAFSVSQFSIGRFTTQFDFQLLNPNADGFTFTIQGKAPTALGGSGGALGYGATSTVAGIPTSVAVKFDLYSNSGEGNDSTGLYLNGAVPESAGSINLGNTGINLHSGHVFRVGMTYDGTTLKVTITDTSTNASASQSYTVNIPGAVGGSNAYIGFTGATGGLTATQNIRDWTFAPNAANAPATPAGFAAASVSATEAALSWSGDASTTSYIIQRKTGAGSFVPVAQVLGATSFLDTGLDVGGQYTYQVQAANPVGTSAPSASASVTLPTPPSPPTNIHATQVTSTEVDLSWQDNAPNAIGYNIFREFTHSSITVVAATLPPGSTSFQDTGLAPNTLYQYHVEPYNAAGYSGDSGLEVTTLTAGPAPAAPTGLTAVGGPGQVALNWLDTPNAASYNIYRSTKSNGEGAVPVQTNLSTTFFTDTGRADGVTYYYEITAIGAGGEGARSVEVSSTTTKPSLDFSGGFANAGSLLAVNGAAAVKGSTLQLTDGQRNERASAFSNAPVNVSQFSTHFNFQLLNAAADGFTFTIQRAGVTALGASGGGLGYGGPGGIPNSVAIKFDLFNNAGEGNNSTGLYVNGAVPTSAGSIDLSGSGLNLHSGHVFGVAMSYDGAVLTVTITDTVTNASATQSYAVDIADVIGGPTAYVGFTAATGGQTATQKIVNWTYAAAP